jgi:hypothetical protein
MASRNVRSVEISGIKRVSENWNTEAGVGKLVYGVVLANGFAVTGIC